MLFVFDVKVVNDKSELDWSCLVHPEAGHYFALVVPVFVQALSV